MFNTLPDIEVAMFRLSLFYFHWIAFWRLPVTDDSIRVESSNYLRKLVWVRYGWLAGVTGLTATGQVAFFVSGILMMTFISFMVLDET